MTVRWVLLLLLLQPCALATGESVEVRLSVESVVLGEPFEVVVVRRHPRTSSVSEFDPAALAPLDFVVVDRRREIDGEDVVESVTGTARAWALERLDVPAIPMVTVDVRGAERVVWSRPLSLTVTGVLAAGDVVPPEPPGEVVVLPLRWRDALPWGCAAIVFAILAACVRRSTGAPEEAAVDPVDAARADLLALRQRFEQGDSDVLPEVGVVLRRLIESTEEIPATRMTSREVGRALTSRGAPEAAAVLATLVAAEEAAYGTGRPTDDEVAAALDAVEALTIDHVARRSVAAP